MTNIYRLKISLVEPHYPINTLHRIIEVSGNIRFDELHQELFNLFEHHGEHLWQFFISRIKMDGFSKLFNDCHECVLLPDSRQFEDEKFLSENKIYNIATTLDAVKLSEKDYFYYWFDFGDGWLHRIRIEKITKSDENDTADSHHFKVIKAVGEIPSPYNDNADVEPPFHPDNISPELDFEISLLSAMMLIAGDPINPMRFGDLIEIGVADELVKRELIKPCVSLTHRVQLTTKGESELARFLDVLDI